MRVEELLDRAMAASLGGRKEEARDLLVDVLALEPDNLEAWLRLAELAASPERAFLYYQRAANIDPRSLRAQKGLDEARARLQPARVREKPARSSATPQEERTEPSQPAAVGSAALPPDAPIFVDSETAPLTVNLRS